MTHQEYRRMFDLVRRHLQPAKKQSSETICGLTFDPFLKITTSQQYDTGDSFYSLDLILEFDPKKVEITLKIDGMWYGNQIVYYTSDEDADIELIVDHIGAFICKTGPYDISKFKLRW